MNDYTISTAITTSDFSYVDGQYKTSPIELYGNIALESECYGYGGGQLADCSLDADFFDTAQVTGFTIDDSTGDPISNATLLSASGTNYNAIPPDNIGATPECSTALYALTGLGAIGSLQMRRRRVAHP